MSEQTGLVSAFLPCVPSAAGFKPPAQLEAALEERLAAGRAAWPQAVVDAAEFARHMAERTTTVLPPLERAADLYIACACACGNPEAVQAFQRVFRADVERVAWRVDSSPSFADDLMQALSERLFVRHDGALPRIAEYAGRASLRGWLGVVAKRTALNMRRNHDDRSQSPLPSDPAALGAVAGPEIALLKARFKHEFEAAIRAALASLPPKERTLLLLHLVDGLTLPALATMQGMSRATVARRLASAREALHDATQRELLGRLRLSPSELASVTALVRSQIELSITDAVRAAESDR